MTRLEHQLTTLAEECNEVGQRAIKACRFGLREIQPGQKLTNAERITEEYAQLVGMYEMLVNEHKLRSPTVVQIVSKRIKFEEFLKYSKKQGTLTGRL